MTYNISHLPIGAVGKWEILVLDFPYSPRPQFPPPYTPINAVVSASATRTATSQLARCQRREARCQVFCVNALWIYVCFMTYSLRRTPIGAVGKWEILVFGFPLFPRPQFPPPYTPINAAVAASATRTATSQLARCQWPRSSR